MNKITTKQWDIIGDIHGELSSLNTLLSKLGYEERGGVHRHPQGRKAIFVGDLIDRGPDSRGVLRLVRNMMEADQALAVMGNHEFNFVSFMTPDGKGGFLRAHTEGNDAQVAATLNSFAGDEDEIPDFVEWMKSLPFFLDLDDFRVVHASWIPGDIEYLSSHTLSDDSFLQETAQKGSRAHGAIERVLKGTEISLPKGLLITDSNGTPRNTARTRWWGEVDRSTWEDLIFPPLDTLPGGLPNTSELERHIAYRPNDPPVFFGHYKLKRMSPFLPVENLMCLDYGLGHGGPATAYRWDGESEPSLERIVQV